MPSCLIEDENGVGAGADLGGNLVEMKLHGLSVAGGQDQGSAGVALRAYRAEQIRRLGCVDRGWRGGVSPSWPSDR
jgi:hypothetical protein